MDFFSIKVCLLNHRKDSSEKRKQRATPLKQNVFAKLGNLRSHLRSNERKKMDFFSIKICLLNHRKFDIMQESSSEKANKELLH